jgi:uncharacterized protein (DUF433 family)
VLALAIERRLSSFLILQKRKRLFRLIAARPNTKRVSSGLVKINLCRPRHELAVALKQLRRCQVLVEVDAGTMGGEPIFRGTRIPVHLIAKLLSEGESETDLRDGYPRLTADMLRLAPMYATAYPLRGRPRKSRPLERTSVRTTRRPLKST